jgi:hypothetical protein
VPRLIEDGLVNLRLVAPAGLSGSGGLPADALAPEARSKLRTVDAAERLIGVDIGPRAPSPLFDRAGACLPKVRKIG